MRAVKKWAFECPTTGQIDTAPWTPEQAAKHGRSTYKDRGGCEICADGFPKMRYVVGNGCVGCFTSAMVDTFHLWCQGMPGKPAVFPTSKKQAIQMGLDWYYNNPNQPLVCMDGPHMKRFAIDGGACKECELIREQQRAIERGPRAAARRAGVSTYMPNEACAECGTIAARSVVTNACSECSGQRQVGRPKGPRALARSSGMKTYVPDFDCPECKTRSDRNVVTNACTQCASSARPPKLDTKPDSPKLDGRRTPTSIMVEMCPEMIISRNDARAAGFTQYRTGDACRRGHTGWRYVSVGTCIQCARGER